VKALALLLLLGCTRVEKTVAAPLPPTLDELQGSYAATWGGTDVLGVAEISLDALFVQSFPCRPEGSADGIGGSFLYDERNGDLEAELKSLDGMTKVVLEGRFRGTGMRGTYEVLVLGISCVSGSLTLERTE
jgi:hypothetical protein